MSKGYIELPARELLVLVQRDNDFSLKETTPRFQRTKSSRQCAVYYAFFIFLNLIYTVPGSPVIIAFNLV